MRFSAPLLTVAGTVAGTAAAVVAYQATAAAGPETSPATRPASVSTQEPAPAASPSWLPCEHGWKVVGTTCVRVKQKVVVVHDLPAPAAAPVAAPARSVAVGAPSPVATPHASGGQTEAPHAEHGDGNEVEHADDANEGSQQVSPSGYDGDGSDPEGPGDDD